MSVPADGRTKVFVSYSHNDLEWLKRLQIHLKDLERQGQFELWDDTKIQPGVQWRKEIDKALKSACVAILLISADFIASDFIADNELPPLLAAAEDEGLVILPLILSPSRFENIESFSKFQAVNPPSKPLVDLSRGEQERFFVKLSADVLQAIEEAQMKPANAGIIEPHQVSNLPFARNEFFTGRDDVLNGLHTGFITGQMVQALNGFGGVGKTQTALEYAYRYQQHYRFLLWSKAHSRETLVSDFVSLAGLLKLPEKNALDQSEVVSAVKRWFEIHDNWLLILDNADDLVLAREFIPLKKTGHVLLTTRAQNTKPIAVQQPIEKMASQEGALFLLHRLEKIKKEEPLASAPEELRKQAEALSKAVDGLPLALDQAAAFIEEMPSTLEEYLRFYESWRTKLLSYRGELAEDHSNSVTVTFSLAFQKVAEANSTAADLLRLCAFLEADSIPEEIFREWMAQKQTLGKRFWEYLKKFFGRTLDSPTVNLTNAIKEAGRFSLLQRNAEARTFSLHRLVQVILKDKMDIKAERLWAKRAIRAVSSAFPNVEFSTWPLCGRLILHAQLLASVIDTYGFTFPEASRLLHHAGWYVYDRAQYKEAETLLLRALAIRENAFGAKYIGIKRIYVWQSLDALAQVYYRQNKLVEAGTLYLRALAIQEKTLGVEHPDVAASLYNLAFFYHTQGKVVEAEAFYLQTLAIQEKMLGAEHPAVVACLTDLALLYYDQGKVAEADTLYLRVLAIQEKTISAEHVRVGITDGFISYSTTTLHYKHDRIAEAEAIYLWALTIQEKTLGVEHPDVATSLYGLACFYMGQGKIAEAEPLYLRALAIREKTLGAEHPDNAPTLKSLALLYTTRGKITEAEPLYLRALTIQEKALGPEHPYVAENLHSLAFFYYIQGKITEAEPLYLRALTIQEKVLGPEHLDTADTLNSLALLYDDQNKGVEAEALYLRALAIREKALGPEHLDVANTLNSLASLSDFQGKDAEAKAFYLRALAIQEKTPSAKNPYVAGNIDGSQSFQYTQGRIRGEESFHLRALATQEKALGAEHLDVANTLNSLASLYGCQNKDVEAEALYLRALAIREKALGAKHPDVIAILNCYAALLRKMKKDAEAEKIESGTLTACTKSSKSES